ncbi:hypothetical protein [Nesterenkonia sandarakina]|uniref:hypothetical protein n=1 Tax=Nesterenkonia sandarakina TaxID=272918 RepID=UPI0011B29A00|nr:hypothetical protein [Nesterenkonia sandarakina]
MITINGIASTSAVGMNPTLSPGTGIAPWIIGIVLVGLLVWAVAEVTRNKTFGLIPKVALILLALLAPVVGPLITIAVVRAATKHPSQVMA